MNCPPILGLTDRADHADAHWRLVRPLARLKEAGVDTALCWLDSDEMPTLPAAGRVVVLQRVVVKGGSQDAVRRWVQRLRDAGALAVVFEMDDDVVSPAYMEYIDACGGLELVRRTRLLEERRALEWSMQACDAVTVSTEPLAAVVRRYTDAPVHVVENYIDVEWFRARLSPKPAWSDHLTIGWAGGRRPEADLEVMAVAWGRIAERYPAVRFVVAGWQPDTIYQHVDDQRIYRVPWADLDEYPRAYQVDIGCTPLADTPFNRCKSPIKAMEYRLAGAVVVGTPWLYGNLALQWADTVDEWTEALAFMIEDEGWLKHHQACAHERVEDEHTLSSNLHRWQTAYSEIAASTRVPA